MLVGISTGFNNTAEMGGTIKVMSPLVAKVTDCTPPVHEPSGLMGAPPRVYALVLLRFVPVNSMASAAATFVPRLRLTSTPLLVSLLFNNALMVPLGRRTPYAVKLMLEDNVTIAGITLPWSASENI